MSKFNMIKEAQTLSNIKGTKRYEILTSVRDLMGKGTTLTELDKAFSPEIKKSDYNRWMNEIHRLCKKEGRNVDTKRNFDNCAFAVLDDDPRMDVIGNDETTKVKIVSTLWHAHNAAENHKRASRGYEKAAKNKAHEDEEMMMNHIDGCATEEEETAGSEEHLLSHITKAGYQQAHIDHAKRRPGHTKSPYHVGTLRHNLWKEGYSKGMNELMYGHVAAGEEEEAPDMTDANAGPTDMDAVHGDEADMDDLDRTAAGGATTSDDISREPAGANSTDPKALAAADLEGFEACMTAHGEGADMDQEYDVEEGGEEKPSQNPYDEETPEHEAWQAGYDRAESYFEEGGEGEDLEQEPELDTGEIAPEEFTSREDMDEMPPEDEPHSDLEVEDMPGHQEMMGREEEEVPSKHVVQYSDGTYFRDGGRSPRHFLHNATKMPKERAHNVARSTGGTVVPVRKGEMRPLGM